MKKILVAIFLVIPLLSSGQNISRGYKLLEKYDYEKAEEIFSSSYISEKNKAASALALAFIYADERSPYFNLVESWHYATDTKLLINELTTDEIQIIGEYFINTEARRSSRPVISKIEYGLETIEAKLIKYVREENDLDLAYEVLDRFPDFRYYGNVIHIRNYLEFRKSEKENTIKAYSDFISRFPEAAQIDKAKKYIRSLELEDVIESNNPEALKAFIVKYPETPEFNIALRELHRLAFAEARQKNTFEAMEAFITEFPDALETAEASDILRQLLYEYAKSIKTLEAYNNFILKYPEGEYFVDIFNLKASDLGAGYLSAKPVQPGKVIWTRMLEDQGWLAINAVTTVDNSNNYLTGATIRQINGEKTDVWIIKESANGVTLWNRRIAEDIEQNIKFIGVADNGNLVGMGDSRATGADTIKETRLFSLGADGRKLWSRAVEIIEPESFLLTSDGDIVMGGYMQADSIVICGITISDSEGRELITRGYSISDTIRNIIETASGNLVIAGSTWVAEIDMKGHIISETYFTDGFRINSAVMTSEQLLICSGTRENINLLLITDLNSNKKAEKSIEKTGNLLLINSNEVVLHALSDRGYSMNILKPSDGSSIDSVIFPGINLSDIKIDKEGKIISTIVENGSIVLIRSEVQF